MTQIRFDGCDLSPRAARTPRYAPQPTRVLAAATAVLVLLAGCGGSGRMSKPEYERTVNDDGRLLSSVFGSVDQGTTNLHQLSVRVTRARAQLDRVRSDLDDLKPPKQAELVHRQLVVALDTLSQDLWRLAQTADAGDRAGVQEARARLSAPARQLVAAIQELQQAGFDINNG
jgi:hypothetical protein